MPVVRTDGQSVGRSRDYQIFWDGYITLSMELRYKPVAAFIFEIMNGRRYYVISKVN